MPNKRKPRPIDWDLANVVLFTAALAIAAAHWQPSFAI